MLDEALPGPRISRQEYAKRSAALRVDLVNAQFDLQNADFSVVVLIAGDDRLGANDVIRLMHEWMDARLFDTHVFLTPSAEELERPRFWRYWRVLPPRGRIGVYFGAWGQNAVGEHARGRIDEREFRRRLDWIRQFEHGLAAGGTLVVKFWMHLPRPELEKRMRKAAADENANWQLEETDWQLYEIYDEALPHIETLVAETGTPRCRWHVLPGHRKRYRNLRFAEILRDAVTARLAGDAPPLFEVERTKRTWPDALGGVDLSRSIPKKRYSVLLEDSQARLARLTRQARREGRSAVLVFEGWDAAGKGGTIRRLTAAMAVRDYRVAPVAAPSDEELARHYLWRFWRRLPRAGRMLIFDRSWYGRVLVERVEGYADVAEWKRAYDEIADFESQLIDRGIVLRKFWLHVDPDEQLARFRARERTPYKKYKITAEDYRNRERRPEYVAAVNEMVARTHTADAPWHLVAANDKRHARIEVIRTVCEALEQALGGPVDA